MRPKSGSGGGEQLGWPPGFQLGFGGDLWGDRPVLGLLGEGEREFLRLAAGLLLLLALPQG